MDSSVENTMLKTLMDIKEDTGATKTGIEDLRAELMGPNGHITRLYAHNRTQDTRYWIGVAILAPLMYAIQATMRKYGIS